MVLCGVMKHPREWPWCGYQELMGLRRQYRIMDSERLMLLSMAAERGRKLFEDPVAGCATCHPAPLFTDLKRHAVGTERNPKPPEQRFDSPTLIECWRTAPYLHDGSAVTLHEVLTSKNAEDRHGKTSHLSPEVVEELVIYIGSISYGPDWTNR